MKRASDTGRRKASDGERAASRGERTKRKWWVRLIGWGIITSLTLMVAGAAFVASMFYYYGSDVSLPGTSKVRDYNPKTVTRIYDRNGILIGELASERRTVVPYDKIPKVLINAVVSAEDADFFKHKGLDYMGMLRAFLANLRAGRFVQGGSTITQQVVKTFFLTPKRTIRRKMQEVILARRLENELRKEEILRLYLNQIYFGHGRYGVQEASRFFFGKDVNEIGLGEAALLAGLPQSPERLSPLKHPSRAKRRQLYVLKELARRGYVSQDVASAVAKQPIRVVRHRRPYLGAAPEITDIVRAHLAKAFGEKKLATLGKKVYTTIDIKLQVAAREAVRWGLRAIDARHGYRRRARHVKAKKRAKTSRWLAREQKKIVYGKHYLALVTKVGESLEADIGGGRKVEVSVDDERYNPQQHAPAKRFSVGDLVRVRATRDEKRFVFDAGPQGALVAIEPGSGEVLAMVGGYDYRAGEFNRATQAMRQPGSSFKPFVYGAALQSGKYTPASIVDDAPVVFKGWEPRNFDGKHRGPLRLRVALAHSVNTVAAKLISDVGVDAVRKLASDLGISTALGRDLSIALGSSSVRVIDLASAYAAIAGGGKRAEPRIIRRIGGEPVRASAPTQAMKPEVAFVLARMMQSVVQQGTARRARRLRRPVAGKTGTTNKQKDAWFAGFAPQIATVVWVGFDSPRSIGYKETGGRAALPIWVRFMREALKGKSRRDFKQPPNVVVARIDPKTGLLAAEGAADAIEEVFVAGTQPTKRARAADQVDPDTILMDSAVR
ncbi:MAG: PBP1A family penicillin-binding protein [Myxococcales bacterium]|nr:PBP1A family penicillin-binding protein [Myxococcales bacterium]